MVYAKFWVQNFIFPNGKQILPNSLINSWNLKKWNNSFIMSSLNCGQPCLNFPSYFQQWNLNKNIAFHNSFTDSRLGILNLGPRLYLQVFPNSQGDWKLGFLNVALAWILNFSQFMDVRDWQLEFWNISLEFISKFFPVH